MVSKRNSSEANSFENPVGNSSAPSTPFALRQPTSSRFTSNRFNATDRSRCELFLGSTATQPDNSTKLRFFSPPQANSNSRPTFHLNRRPQSQLSSPVKPSIPLFYPSSQDSSFQAGSSIAASSPQPRRPRNSFRARAHTGQSQSTISSSDLPSRPALKRRHLTNPDNSGSIGDTSSSSQQSFSFEASAMETSVGPSRQRLELLKDDIESLSLSRKKNESTTTGLEKGWQPDKSGINPDGDLCLKVGFGSTEFVVDSKLLARVSPVWKKLLDTEFRQEKKPGEAQDGNAQRVLKLPDDNPAAMEIFLNIIHGRFDQISGYDQFVYCVHLYSLCVLTNKYDMTHLLRPWAKGWSGTVHINCDRLGDSLRTKFCHERLWIAWEFGDTATFEKIAETILLESSSSSGYCLKYVGAAEPTDIYGNINGTRLYVIKSLLDSVGVIIEGLIQNREALVKCTERKADCVPSVLGKAIQSLHRVGLWPLPEPEKVHCSVNALVQNLRLIDFGYNQGSENSEMDSHVCSERLHKVVGDMIDVTLKSIPSVLTPAHHRCLEQQAKKSGFSVNNSAKP